MLLRNRTIEKMVQSLKIDTLVSIRAVGNIDVNVFPDKNVIRRSDQQTINVVVTDSILNMNISGVTVRGVLFYPDGTQSILLPSVTNQQGQTSYSWIMGNESQIGNYSVSINVNASGSMVNNSTRFNLVSR